MRQVISNLSTNLALRNYAYVLGFVSDFVGIDKVIVFILKFWE